VCRAKKLLSWLLKKDIKQQFSAFTQLKIVIYVQFSAWKGGFGQILTADK